MTTSRIVRGTKARIFLYISAVLIIIALIACYNNTLTQLEDVRKSNEICHQQEENLSIQLQVITDYKQRLEKSLKTEKAEHQQTKNDLENKLNEEHNKNEKSSNDLNLRFTSLQQHFNILQTQHDDFKEECSKTQNRQLNEINDLQAKLKEIQEELKKIESTKESLKTQYLQMQSEKEQLERQLKTNTNLNEDSESRINHLTKINHELEEKLHQLREKCPFELLPSSSSSSSPIQHHNMALSLPSPPSSSSSSSKKSDRVLSIPKISNLTINTTKSTTESSLNLMGSLNNAQPIVIPASATPKSAKSNVQDQPPQSIEMLNNNNDDDNNRRIPEGVVPAPVVDNPSKTDDDNNNNNRNNNDENDMRNIDVNNDPINSRYRNKINSAMKNDNVDDNDDNNNNKNRDDIGVGIDDNAANEIGVDFGNINDRLKNVDKNAMDRQVYEDQRLEDDDDEYGDRLDKHKDPIVRN